MSRRCLIAETFKPVAVDIDNGRHREYWIKGGRGSTKSSFISLYIALGMIDDRQANAIIYRRYNNTIKDSVFAQMIWALQMLGVADYWHVTKSPLEMIRKSTGQRIMFRGLDDPMKAKSIKLTYGYFKYLWFEEAAELRGYEEIRTIKQSVFRGTKNAITLFSYNPPKSANAWVNAEVLKPDHPERFVHSSTYLDVNPDWLGDDFISDAETLKRTNPLAYRNEYLGDVTGNGGNVFENLSIRQITDEEINGKPDGRGHFIGGFEWFYQGVDWGYFPDPFAWVRCAFDSKRRKLYVVDEVVGNKLSNLEAFNRVREKLKPGEDVTADSAEPKSIADWREYGCSWIRGANKAAVGGHGSVAYSMKWLASLTEIIIDPQRCPTSAREFSAYEYERNSAGEFVSGYVDGNDHCISAVRYGLSPVWRRRGL